MCNLILIKYNGIFIIKIIFIYNLKIYKVIWKCISYPNVNKIFYFSVIVIQKYWIIKEN